MARRRFDDEGSGALSESFLSVPESEGLVSSIPQPPKPPVPKIRRSMFPSAVAEGEVTRVAPSQMAPPPAPPSPSPESRLSKLPPPALPPKAAPLPPMRAPMHSDSGITLRREHAPDPDPTTAAISIENTRPVSDRIQRSMVPDEGTSVTRMHPLDLEQIAKSRRPEQVPRPSPSNGPMSPSFGGFEEPTALFDRSAVEAGARPSSQRVDSSRDEESTRLLDRSQLIDPREPVSSDFEASTRVVRDRAEGESAPPAPLHSPLVALPAERAPFLGDAVVSSIENYSGSLSGEAISLQSGDLVPLDEPSSPWARSSLLQPERSFDGPAARGVDSSGGRSMRFDFGADESDPRSELEFLPESLEMDPSRPFRDALGAPRMPLDLSSIDSSDVISAPPSLEPAPPPSVRPPPVAAPIAWGRHERKAPAMARGALPAPGRLAGRPRNLAGPPRAPKEQASESYAPESVQPAAVQSPLPPVPVASPPPPAYVPAPPVHAAPAYVAPSPPEYVAPAEASQSYVPQPRRPLDGYSSGAQLAYSPYGSDHAGSHAAPNQGSYGYGAEVAAYGDAYADPGQPSLPDYDEAPLSDLPDPRGYAGDQPRFAAPAPEAEAKDDPYAPAPEWGAGFLNGKRPDSSYREFVRPAPLPGAEASSSSEASFVGGKFIDESVQSASPGALAAARVYESVAEPRRNLVGDYATRPRGGYDDVDQEPHFPAPPSSRTGDGPPSDGGGAYDSGISQQFQSLPILPTASELLAQAAERGQPAMVGAPPPAPRAVSSSVVAAPAPRSRVLWLAYSLLLGGVGMVALVHFTFGDDGQSKGTTAVSSASVPPPPVSAPAPAQPVAPYGYGQPGAMGYPPEGTPGYVPGAMPQGYPQPGAQGYPPPGAQGYPPPGLPYGYPPQPVYATPTTVTPPAEEASAKPKPKAPPKSAAPKPPPPPPKPKDDEKPPSTSDSKPAKDSSGKANADLLNDALN